MSKVLLLSSSFAPEAVVASMRFSFLTKEFEKYDIESYVVASEYRNCLGKDYTIPQWKKVSRVKMIPEWPASANSIWKKIKHRLWIRVAPIDGASGWILPAIIRGVSIVRRQGIQLVIATTPPASSLVAGFAIAKITGSKYILDYRDPWISYHSSYGKFKTAIMKRIEHYIIHKSTSVVACTNTIKASLVSAYNLPESKVTVITNGYCIADVNTSVDDDEAFTLTFAGSFYGERNLAMISNAVIKVKKECPGKRPIRIHVYGKVLDSDITLFKKMGIDGLIVAHEKCDYQEIIRTIKGSNALFLPSGRDHYYALPFKLFDYLSVRKPILAVTPARSELWQFMLKHKVGELADIYDEYSIYTAFKALYTGTGNYNWDSTNIFTWDVIGERYSKHIKSIE